jgi:D-amino-acid oxidase
VPDGKPAGAWFAKYMRDFKEIPGSKLPPNYFAGAVYESIMVNVPQYLRYLQQTAVSKGANSIRAFLPTDAGLAVAFPEARKLLPAHLQKVDAWVNATGLGARTLVPDSAMFPIRGQTIIVKGEAARITTIEDKSPTDPKVTYVLPRPGSGISVLGGTKEPDDWRGEPDDETTKQILERSKQWAPELLTGKDGGFEVVEACVGFRPGRRGGPRIEIEVLGKRGVDEVVVCHAYGHAGAG